VHRGKVFVAAVLVTLLAGGAWILLRATSRSGADRGSVLLVGDSLNVGMEPYLREALEGWTIAADDVVGRATAAGLEALAGRLLPSGAVVISLGTNDPPGDVETFRHGVGRAIALAGRDSCVVWATIWRDGAANEAFNEVLREAAREQSNFRVLDWAAMLEEHPAWLGADGTHASPEGYRARAEEAARLVRSCAVARPSPASER
jgi:lysophospholipase L1-like esterase